MRYPSAQKCYYSDLPNRKTTNSMLKHLLLLLNRIYQRCSRCSKHCSIHNPTSTPFNGEMDWRTRFVLSAVSERRLDKLESDQRPEVWCHRMCIASSLFISVLNGKQHELLNIFHGLVFSYRFSMCRLKLMVLFSFLSGQPLEEVCS